MTTNKKENSVQKQRLVTVSNILAVFCHAKDIILLMTYPNGEIVSLSLQVSRNSPW